MAGLAGLAATLAASAALVMQGEGPAAVALLFRREVPAGLWLSWHVIAIIVTGVFFHRANLARGGGIGGTGRSRRRRAASFRLLPAGALRRIGDRLRRRLHHRAGGAAAAGDRRPAALLLGLYSQSLVPWGALAIGTTVGATLAGLTPNQLGLGSAVLQVPIHFLYLGLYWRFAREAGVPCRRCRSSTTRCGRRCCWR